MGQNFRGTGRDGQQKTVSKSGNRPESTGIAVGAVREQPKNWALLEAHLRTHIYPKPFPEQFLQAALHGACPKLVPPSRQVQTQNTGEPPALRGILSKCPAAGGYTRCQKFFPLPICREHLCEVRRPVEWRPKVSQKPAVRDNRGTPPHPDPLPRSGGELIFQAPSPSGSIGVNFLDGIA